MLSTSSAPVKDAASTKPDALKTVEAAKIAAKSTKAAPAVEEDFKEPEETEEAVSADLSGVEDLKLLDSTLDGIIVKQFRENFGRAPTDIEKQAYKNRALNSIINPENDEEDEEYVPTEAEIEETKKLEELDEVEADEADAEAKAVSVGDEDIITEGDDKLSDADFDAEYKAAMEVVKSLGRLEGSAMLSRIVENLEKSGESVDVETVSSALSSVRDTVMSDVTSTLESEEAFAPELSEEEFAKEMSEALENVRKLARADGLLLAEKVSGTFADANGREPSEDELKSIFGRMQLQLAAEAEDEILDDLNEVICELPVADSSEASVDLSASEKEAIVALAKSVVTQEMAQQACEYFEQLTGRYPNLPEFNDLLLSVAVTRFVENNIDCDETDDDSDYDPNDLLEQDLLRSDMREDLFEDAKLADKENLKKEISELMSLSETINGTRPVFESPKPVAFYSPIASDKKSKSVVADSASLDAKLFDRAIANFKVRYERDPTDDEIATLKTFLGQTERLEKSKIDFSAGSEEETADDKATDSASADISA